MGAGQQEALLLELASDETDVDAAAQRLFEEGADAEVLSQVEGFVQALDSDPSARNRALLLVERTRILTERGVAGAGGSEGPRADPSRMGAGGGGHALGTVGGVLHHELSTPITVARSALEALTATSDDPAAVEQMAEIAVRSLRLASRLLESLGRAERLQTGRSELSWDQVELGELVRECVAEVRGVLVGRHEVSVTAEGAVELPADPDAVRQILFNLLTNAAKFSPEGSRIEISVTAAGDDAEVAVRDRGPGVSPQDAARIFEAGQRLDPDAPGTGLGLFIARQLARAHGGDLHVEAVPGGSRFVVHLPLSGGECAQSLDRPDEA